MIPFEPMGDGAVLARFSNEAGAMRFAAAVRASALAWSLDVVQAYFTVAVFFDQDCILYRDAAEWLAELRFTGPMEITGEGQLHHIPCCYEFQLDLERIAQHSGLSADEVVRRHSETVYTVYAIGFCPGFPYLGYLPESLCGVSRLDTPRVRVEAGSIGLTGRQTGIYTEPRPGGWNLVGRTPLELVNVVEGYFPLRTGDRVRFEAIDVARYRELAGTRLG